MHRLERDVEVLGAPPLDDLIGVGPGREDLARAGASKVRVTSTWVAASGIVLSFRAEVLEVGAEPVHPALPQLAVGRHPGRVASFSGSTRSALGRYCASRSRVMRPARSSTFRCRETAGRLISNGEASSLTVVWPLEEPRQDGAAGGVGEGGERLAERVGLHCLCGLVN